MSRLVVWPFAGLVVLLVAAGLLADAWEVGEGATQVASALWYLAWGAWTVRLCRWHGIRLGPLARPPRHAAMWSHVLVAVPLLLLAGGLVWLQMVLASLVAPSLVEGWLAGERAATGGALVVVGVVTTVVLAPAVEELVFRGVLLRRWMRRRGRVAALLGTAALFAVLHPGDLLGSFVFGVVLGVIQLRTGSLRVPVACHALHNALAELLASDALPVPRAADTLSVAQLQGAWWVGAACVAAAALVIWAFLRRQWVSLAPRRPRSDRASLPR